jgi:hypothetical protein
MGVKLGFSPQKNNNLRVFENRVLRRIFGLKREKVTRGCGKLHNKQLRDLYHAHNNIVRKVKSMRMKIRRRGHVIRMR